MLRVGSPRAVVVWLSCLELVFGSIVAARAQRDAPRGFRPRLVSADQGEAIVDAAAEYRDRARSKPDCSHLVHQIYELAGLTYPYASSFKLYTGIEAFGRVRAPQPGDVIVWRGHVGIVVDPARHSFYSSVGSGLRVEDYNSAYWKRRGPARFYRYALGGRGEETMVASRRAPRADRESAQVTTAPVIEDDQPTNSRPTSTNSAAEPAGSEPRDTARVEAASNHDASAAEVPPNILIASRGVRPTNDEVAQAISELADSSDAALRGGDLSSVSPPVTIFAELRVEHLRLRKDQGSARVRVESIALLDRGQIDLNRRHEKRDWELRRTGEGWVAFTPSERAYLPRDVAARVLADRLASLTRKPSRHAAAADLREQALLARVLNAILNPESPLSRKP